MMDIGGYFYLAKGDQQLSCQGERNDDIPLLEKII